MRKRRGTRTYAFICIVLIVVFVYMVDSVIALPLAEDRGMESFGGNANMETVTLFSDDRSIQLYSELINVLQALDVLPTPRNSSICMAIESVKRPTGDSMTRKSGKQLGVFLYFKEVSFQNALSATSNVHTGHVKAICKQSSKHGIFAGLDSDSLKQGHGNYTKQKPENNTTSVFGGQSSKTVGLSNTQVAVIVTCAVVLGLFFIIAGALRVRSCVKRYRLNREAAALSVTGRPSAIGLNGSNFSTGNSRRDSSSSKASRQSNPSVKSGVNLQINPSNRAPTYASHNTSQVHSNDHNPLLPVRSVAQGSETGSSHGSLAYIDDESQSKIKVEPLDANESDIDSEDDPLLRKSPDSGSSIDVTMADVYKVDTESSESYREIFEPNGDRQPSDSTDGAENSECQVNTTANITSQDSVIVDDERPLNRGSSVDVDPEFDPEVTRRRPSCPKQQFSVDSYANDCTDWEYGNDIYAWPEEDTEEDTNISNSYAVTIGLSQSNSSISNNPSYCYGNQSEYVYKSGYGNTAYMSPFQLKPLDNYIPYNDKNEAMDIDANEDNGNHRNGLCVENISNQTDSLSPSDISTGSQTISKDSSGEPLIIQNHQHSRTPSNGTKRLSGADNLALVDSGEDEPCTGITPCTVVTQIVPLAEYHRNSVC